MAYVPNSPELHLDQRVCIERLVEDRDAHGELRQVYEDERSAWADIRPLAGREYWYAQQVRSDVTTKVVMRWFEGLTPNHRIRHRGRILGIVSIQDIEEGRTWWLCMCKEVVR